MALNIYIYVYIYTYTYGILHILVEYVLRSSFTSTVDLKQNHSDADRSGIIRVSMTSSQS